MSSNVKTTDQIQSLILSETDQPDRTAVKADIPALPDILRFLPEAVYLTDASGRISYFNDAAAKLWGQSPQLGRTRFCGAWKLFTVDGRPLPHTQCPLAIALKERRLNRGREVIVERPDGSRATILTFPTPLFDDDGNLTGAVNILIDVTHRSALFEEAQRFTAIVDSSDDAILTKDLNGTIMSWNQGAERLFGYRADEIIGKPVTTLMPSDRHDEEPNILLRIRTGEKIDHYETVRRHKDGSLIEISLTVSPIHNREGKIIGASKIARDITERRRAEEQQQLLIREMNHRIKNLFTLAASVVSLSARSAGSVKELTSAVLARLNALAVATDLTIPDRSTPQGAQNASSLHELIRLVTAPYGASEMENDAPRISISGPDISLVGSSVTSFALLLHEFATNATKYGALSSPQGTVEIQCDTTRDLFTLSWIERGGPVVEHSGEHEGFGSVLGRATVSGQLGGEIHRQWRPEGLVINLNVDLRRVQG